MRKYAKLRMLCRGSGDRTTMNIDKAVNIEDLHRMAKRRLPKIAFDFIEGGLEDERGLETNTSAFHKHQLLPRYLVDVSTRDQSKTIFGQTFASPFGISPTGGAGLFRYHADLMLAEAARDANIPYIMSGASNDSIEAAAKIAPKNHWYQLYAARDPAINADLIRRTADAGLGALVLTVDTPAGSKRERNIRNGFANIRGGLFQALSLKPSILAEALTHPGWIVEYLQARRRDPDAAELAALCAGRIGCRGGLQALQLAATVQRPDLARSGDLPQAVPARPRRKRHHEPRRRAALRRGRLRRHPGVEPWRAPARSGARLARRVAGDQGRGRRQADLAARQRGPPRRRYPDSTLSRRRFLLLRRPTLYGAAAGGLLGVKKAIDIFVHEIDLVMGQIGCPSLDQLGPDFLWTDDWQRNR